MGYNHAKAVCGFFAALSLVLVAMGCEKQPMEPLDDVTSLVSAEGAISSVTAKLDLAGARLDHLAACNLGNSYTLEIDNEFLPLPVGRRWVLEGREQGEAIRVQITVLNQIEIVGGVPTRVVEEREWTGKNFNELELIERSVNYYAQVDAGPYEGTVCYFGEAVFPASIGGSWRADNPNSDAGIFMPAEPEVGDIYFQEDAPNAKDLAGHVGEDKNVVVPYGKFPDTVLVRDCSRIEEPGCDPLAGDGSLKVYAEGVGYIADGPAELVRFRPGGP